MGVKYFLSEESNRDKTNITSVTSMMKWGAASAILLIPWIQMAGSWSIASTAG